MIKTLTKLGTEANYLNIIKAIFQNPTVNITFNNKKLKDFPLRSETSQGCHLLKFLFNIALEVLAREIRQEQEIKFIQVRNEEVKFSLFIDGVILYVENLTDSRKIPVI